MEQELMGVLMVKERESHNKIMHFKWANEGTTFFVKKSAGGYIFTRRACSKSKPLTVREIKSYPRFRYIEVGPVIKENGYMAVIKKENEDYLVRPATEGEIEKHAKKSRPAKSGRINRNCSAISMSAADAKKLWTTDTLRMKVTMTDKRLFIEAKAINDGEAERLPTKEEAASLMGGWLNIRSRQNVTMTFKLPYKSYYKQMLYVSLAFIRRAGSEDGTVYDTWFKDDGTFVICSEPLYCDVCGKKIDRYYTETNYVYTCKDCAEKVSTFTSEQKSVFYDAENYKEILDDLLLIKQNLKNTLGAASAQ